MMKRTTIRAKKSWFSILKKALSILQKAQRTAKGSRKLAIKSTLQKLVVEKTPSELEGELQKDIDRLKMTIQEMKKREKKK